MVETNILVYQLSVFNSLPSHPSANPLASPIVDFPQDSGKTLYIHCTQQSVRTDTAHIQWARQPWKRGKRTSVSQHTYLWHSVISEACYLKRYRRNRSNFFKVANTVSLWTRESKLHWSPIKNEDNISQLLTSSSYLTWMPVILTCTFFITWVASFSKKVSFFSSFGLARTRKKKSVFRVIIASWISLHQHLQQCKFNISSKLTFQFSFI